MITDKETNHLYLSQLIKEKDEYKAFWERLRTILINNNIGYSFIKNSRDIWCRDYMPVQIDEEEYVEFTYFPDYYLEPEYIAQLTIQKELEIYDKIAKSKSNLIVDGGNIVKSKNKVIMTDKVFDVNDNLLKKTVINELKKELKVEEIYFIPRSSNDPIGHADAMVRFLDENTLLVADYSDESPTYQKKMKKVLDATKLKIELFPYAHVNEKNKDGDDTAKGIYINYARIGDKVLFPQFDIADDKEALDRAKELFSGCDVIPINCNEIAEEGGVLNCVSWNIKITTKTSLFKGVQSEPDLDDQLDYVFMHLNQYVSIFDYYLISDGFIEAWNAMEGQMIGDGDFKYMVYRYLEQQIPENLIPQEIVDEVVDLILDYLTSIGQWSMDISEN